MQELVIDLWTGEDRRRKKTSRQPLWTKSKKEKVGFFFRITLTDDNVSRVHKTTQGGLAQGVVHEGGMYTRKKTRVNDGLPLILPLLLAFGFSQNISDSIKLNTWLPSNPLCPPLLSPFFPWYTRLAFCPLVEHQSVLLASSIASVMDEQSPCCDRLTCRFFSPGLLGPPPGVCHNYFFFFRSLVTSIRSIF